MLLHYGAPGFPSLTCVSRIRLLLMAPLLLVSLMLSGVNAAFAAERGTPCCDIGSHVLLPVINFDNNSSALSVESTQSLDRLVDTLAEHDAMKLTVFGHTDSRGSSQYNQRLSEKRANAVVKYLLDRGVAASRLEILGLSAARPMATNSDETGRADNRRVVFAER